MYIYIIYIYIPTTRTIPIPTISTSTNKRKPRKNRSKNIIWFNPTFSSNVETNVARRFLNLVKKHFSKHRYHKIFNKYNIKVSYSYMDNMEKLVKKHNNNLSRKSDTNKRNRNCRPNNTCSLYGQCSSSNIVYSAEVFFGNNQQGDKYFGICQTEFTCL